MRLVPSQYVKPYVKRGKNDRDEARELAALGHTGPKLAEERNHLRTAQVVRGTGRSAASMPCNVKTALDLSTPMRVSSDMDGSFR